MKPLLVAKNLARSYDGHFAIDGVSFQAHEGTVIGLLGPNGAGKTTLVRVLTTILEPTRGAFSVDEIPYTDPVAIRARIGVLPENNGYPMQLTGREYLQLHAGLYGASDSVAEQLLREVGLAERGGDRIRVYSRGMRQRLGIARALVNDPKVVFLDEPTLGLDPQGQQQILGLVRTAAKTRGAVVVYSTHFLEEVEEVCDEVLILNKGRVVLRGPLGQLQGAAAQVRLQVPHEQVVPTLALVAKAGLRGEVDGTWIRIDVRDGEQGRLLEALGRADVPVQRLTASGGRLRDTFLAITEATAP